MIENYLLVGLGWFLLGIVIDWIMDWAFSKNDGTDEYIKSLERKIDALNDEVEALNDEVEAQEELIEEQKKMIALQKIAIDTYRDVLAVKEVVG